jgi:hypothetical protein
VSLAFLSSMKEVVRVLERGTEALGMSRLGCDVIEYERNKYPIP